MRLLVLALEPLRPLGLSLTPSPLSLLPLPLLPHSPIHTQRIFLSAPLRAALLASHGVRSFRILQRPHQAVFIPAGCAHQVCNLADCIKVATDFVSTENVARCWKRASRALVLFLPCEARRRRVPGRMSRGEG